MKPSKKALLAALLLGSFAPFAAFSEDGCDKKGYPPTLVDSFMKGCVSKPEFKEFCECTITNLQSKMSLYDFVEIGNTGAALQKDARFTESTNTCLSKVKAPAAAE